MGLLSDIPLTPHGREFRAVFDFAAIGMALVGIDGRFLEVNRALCDLTGYTAEELRARRFQDITHPDDLDADLEQVARLLAGEIRSYNMEKRYVHKNRRVVWILLSASVVRRENGEPLYFIAQIQDITARKRAKEELRTSEARYRNLFQNMADGYMLDEIVLDEHGVPRDYRFLEVNAVFERILGLPREAVVGRTVLEILPQTEPYWIKRFGQVALTGHAAHFEQYSAHFDRYFEVSAFAPTHGQFAVIFRDVTERKQLHDAVYAREEEFRALVENSPDGIARFDASLRRTYANPAVTTLAGKSVLGKTNRELGMPAQSAAILDDAIRAVFATGTERHLELTLPTPKGERQLEARLVPEFGPDGRVRTVLGVTRDVTDRKRAEQAALDQFRLAEAFFTHSVSGLVVLDRNYNFLRVNEAYARGSRRDVSEFVGRNHFEMYPSDAKAIFDEVVRTKQSFATFTRPFVYPDQPERGVTYWDWTLVPVLDDAGEVKYLVFSLVDVTERKRAEEALREREALLQQVLEALPVGVWLTDRSGKIVRGNPAAHKVWEGARYVGVKEYDEYRGWWYDTGRKIEAEEWALARAITRGETSIGEVVKIQCFDGRYKVIVNSAVPLRDEAGGVAGAIVVNEDITQLKQTEAELKEAQTALATRVRELEAAIAEVKELRGILPICAYCKNIRNDQNYWQQVEEYLSQHTDVLFTHSICPTCAEKLMADISGNKK